MLKIGGVLRDAGGLWRKDLGLLLTIGGLFLFVPLLALQLLLPGLPQLPVHNPATAPDFAQATRLAEAWVIRVAPWWALGSIVMRYGMLVLLVLYLDGRWPTVGEAMRRALARLPGFVLLVMLLWLPIGAGGFLLLVPGLYIAARLSLVGASLAAGSGRLIGALQGSVARSRGSGLQLLALFVALWFAPFVCWLPLALILGLIGAAVGPGVGMTLLVSASVSALMAATLVTAVLFQVAAYRRLASIKGI